MNRFCIALFFIIFILACRQSEKAPLNKFSDPILAKIADLQDRRLSDSLYQFLSSPNAVYRQEAVLAFASIQDSTAVDKIGRLLLLDSDSAVRMTAAFAMGQNPSS